MAAALLAAGLAETLLGCEVIAQLDAAAVMKQPLQPGKRGAVVGFVAATPRFGLQEHQMFQPFALQQPMRPADGVVLPGQVPEPRGEDQLHRPGADLISPALIGGGPQAQQAYAPVLEDRRLDPLSFPWFSQAALLQGLRTGMGTIEIGAQRWRGGHLDATPAETLLQLIEQILRCRITQPLGRVLHHPMDFHQPRR